MSVKVQEGMLPVGIEVEGHGIAFNVEYNGDAVEIEVEYPDHGSWSGPRTDTRYITIAREDWDAIVAHVTPHGPEAQLLSALSGDLVPREEHDNAMSWIAPLRDKAAQADALAEALERFMRAVDAFEEKVKGASVDPETFDAWWSDSTYQPGLIQQMRSRLASYRKTASGETGEKVHPNNEDV